MIVRYPTCCIFAGRRERKIGRVSVLKVIARVWPYILLAVSLIGLSSLAGAGRF
jgi:hypothetical protein